MMQITSFFAYSLVMMIGFAEMTNAVDFQLNRALGSMIYFRTGRNPSSFANYGCWCSNKDRPTHAPMDDIDQCCQQNLQCHLQTPKRIADTFYPYRASFEDDTIECTNNRETQAYRLCQCDLVMAECLAKHLDVYTDNLLYVSNDKCSPGVILGFDDFPFQNSTSIALPNNYHNLTITGGNYMFANRYLPRQSGYSTAMVSSPNILTSQGKLTIRRADGKPFSVVSFYAAGAWNDDIRLNLIGSRQYSPVLFNETVRLKMMTRSFIELNWHGIDTLSMNATDGRTLTSYVQYPETLFAIDNLRVRL